MDHWEFPFYDIQFKYPVDLSMYTQVYACIHKLHELVSTVILRAPAPESDYCEASSVSELAAQSLIFWEEGKTESFSVMD